MHGTWSMHVGTAIKSVISYGVFDVCEFLQTRVAKSVTRGLRIVLFETPLFCKAFWPHARRAGRGPRGPRIRPKRRTSRLGHADRGSSTKAYRIRTFRIAPRSSCTFCIRVNTQTRQRRKAISHMVCSHTLAMHARVRRIGAAKQHGLAAAEPCSGAEARS
jgi:hypothetical protein